MTRIIWKKTQPFYNGEMIMGFRNRPSLGEGINDYLGRVHNPAPSGKCEDTYHQDYNNEVCPPGLSSTFTIINLESSLVLS